ncbi:MAG: SWIM zinc finger family protein [Desulfobacterales bacterium]
MNYTKDQVIALAPDASSMTAAKKLASRSKWPLLGHSDEAVWGHCQGSGGKPYEVRIDLNGPAFKCSCPSRKFPCKHALALFLLHADGSGAVAEQPVPDWVSDWLDKRKSREKARVSRAEEKAAKPAEPETIAKKQDKRIETMTSGLNDCELWLRDLVANGLASLPGQGYAVWENAAARLVDAQVPGAAGMVLQMAQITARGSGPWLRDLTILMGKLYLLIKAFQRFRELPEDRQADVRTVAGWPIDRDTVMANGKTVAGTWAVVGESIRDSAKMKEQRVWLREVSTQTAALVLSFSYGGQPPDVSLVPGTCLDAELIFYPGSHPLRALVAKRISAPRPMEEMRGEKTIAQALEKYAEAVSLNPWTMLYPLVIENLVPRVVENRLFFFDKENRRIPAHASFRELWECLALSGGHGLTVAGEWTDRSLLPLAFWNGEGWHRFSAELTV